MQENNILGLSACLSCIYFKNILRACKHIFIFFLFQTISSECWFDKISDVFVQV